MAERSAPEKRFSQRLQTALYYARKRRRARQAAQQSEPAPPPEG